jgi:hypothetical protein
MHLNIVQSGPLKSASAIAKCQQWCWVQQRDF